MVNYRSSHALALICIVQMLNNQNMVMILAFMILLHNFNLQSATLIKQHSDGGSDSDLLLAAILGGRRYKKALGMEQSRSMWSIRGHTDVSRLL